ncbi:ribonuclease P protein subunit p30 [Solea senegalensis]|uniref:Ribonuclease P protein subunit p30 n=3 Tax=Solea senegalensis TaxID=28829 RepID=A0AAV6RR38_SOLSE|nr:ribonuclease P protein subunit p30 [Solea senegalensis]KAG7507474.1 ribonuclease P protein subunit p30 [Solea senegalensis]
MSVFMDLNLTFTEDKSVLQRMIETAAQLGFSTVAINYMFEPKAKKKPQIPAPTPITELMDQLPVVQGRSRPIRVLNRLTLVMSDSFHFRSTAPEYRCFDLLAVQPTTEKLFHAACMVYDIDIICVSVTERLPFFFKRAPVNGAIDRGVVFEVSYSAAIRDSTMRRYTIANAISLIECCKGKSVMVSSAAEKALELRGPYDVTNLSLLFGLSDKDCKEAVSSTCRSVLLHGETRKTASGIIYTVKSCSEASDQQEAPPQSETCEAPPSKKQKSSVTE